MSTITVHLFTILLALCSTISAVNLKGKILKGVVEFQKIEEAPKDLKDGSCLTVNLQDISKPVHKEVSHKTREDIVEEYKKEMGLSYELVMPDKELDKEEHYAISAVLNNGWCKKESEELDEGEWIKDGDFLTDTNFVVENLEKCSASNEKECKGPTISLVKSS